MPCCYEILKTLHILSSTVLFGTGLGIAFFMYQSTKSDCLQQKLFAVKTTVTADLYFTLPAVLVQPLTGLALVQTAGYDWSSTWLTASIALYLLAGCCWLPVVWLQIKIKSIIQQSIETNTALPASYKTYSRIWFVLGWPAFAGLVGVFYLMTTKPV